MFWFETFKDDADDKPLLSSSPFSFWFERFDQECMGNDDDNWAANDHFLSTFWDPPVNFEGFVEEEFRWSQLSNEINTASSIIVRKWVWFFELHSMKALKVKKNNVKLDREMPNGEY